MIGGTRKLKVHHHCRDSTQVPLVVLAATIQQQQQQHPIAIPVIKWTLCDWQLLGAHAEACYCKTNHLSTSIHFT